VISLQELLERAGPNGFSLDDGRRIITQSSILEQADRLRASFPLGKLRPLLSFECVGDALPWLVAADGLSEFIGLANHQVDAATLDSLKNLGSFDCRIPSEEIHLPAPKGGKSSKTNKPPVPTQWILTTSGTTGIPKLVPHTLEGLLRTTKRSNPNGIAPVWGLLYSYDRFAGMQVLLQAIASGSPIIAPPRSASLSQQLEFMTERQVTHLSASPTLWRRILMAPASEAPSLRSITLGGEIADQDLLDALSLRFPKARIVHIYASTEAGVAFSVADRKAGFPTSFLDTPPANVKLRITDNVLELRSSQASLNYIGSTKRITDSDGWVQTGDLVEKRDDRYVFVGRDDSTINVGGLKVQPEVVESAIKSVPGIAEARVFGKSSAITGMLVCAEICLDKSVVNEKAFLKSLKGTLGNLLADYEMPVRIKIVENISVNASGKVERT